VSVGESDFMNSSTESYQVKEFVATWPNVTIENAPEFIKSHKALGADYIKLMQEDCCSLALPTDSVPKASLELQTAVVSEAHANGLVTVGHATSLGSTEIVLKAGADGLTHTFIDQPPTDGIVELYKKTGAFVIPTLCVLASLTNEEQELRDEFADIASKLGLIDATREENLRSVLGMKSPEAKLEYAYQTIRTLKEAGIDIVAGTDSVSGLKGTAIGPSLWMELYMYMNKCGLTVEEALRSATSVSAKRFGFHDRGAIQEGKRADLFLVKGDVLSGLEPIWAKNGIAGVWKAGLKAQ
jgi:imidazolonepropionase-like amidohydrolase